VQLFRGLGSTLGTALLSGLLTAGIVTALGQPANLPFVKTLKKAPQAAAFFTNGVTADTVLNINMQKPLIKDTAIKGISQSQLSVPAKKAAITGFTNQQNAFSKDVIDAFATSLRRVFLVSGSLMAIGFVAVLFVREKPLRNTATHAIAGE